MELNVPSLHLKQVGFRLGFCEGAGNYAELTSDRTDAAHETRTVGDCGSAVCGTRNWIDAGVTGRQPRSATAADDPSFSVNVRGKA